MGDTLPFAYLACRYFYVLEEFNLLDHFVVDTYVQKHGSALAVLSNDERSLRIVHLGDEPRGFGAKLGDRVNIIGELNGFHINLLKHSTLTFT